MEFEKTWSFEDALTGHEMLDALEAAKREAEYRQRREAERRSSAAARR